MLRKIIVIMAALAALLILPGMAFAQAPAAPAAPQATPAPEQPPAQTQPQSQDQGAPAPGKLPLDPNALPGRDLVEQVLDALLADTPPAYVSTPASDAKRLLRDWPAAP